MGLLKLAILWRYLNNMNVWQKAKIIKSSQAASDIKSIVVKPEKWIPHRAGQHYELRISDTDISRKYSVVSSVGQTAVLEFGVQLIAGGVLSPKIWELVPGDEIEIRGPLGESFFWEESIPGPLVLIGVGSGITPLISIYFSYLNKYPQAKCIFIMSAKDESRIMRYDLLKNILLTRLTSVEGRIDLPFLQKNIGSLAKTKNAMCYICGPGNFIDDIVDYVLELGFAEENVRSDRFI